LYYFLASHLASDENIFASDGAIFKFLLQSSSHFSLILINVGTVNVGVPGIDGINDSLFNFTWFGLYMNKLNY